ncbi:MAG: ZIP family zinc transporter [Candidatus Moranbacteria bacterium]|nr:ZIP family zinc transporter [Candidatus Moranbacteria bacterium]
MTIVFLYALINGFSLVAGAFIGIYFKLQQKVIAAVMAFGSGVLICALTFGLMEEAFGHGGFDSVITGFLIGGILYMAGDYAVHHFGGRKHRRHQHSPAKHDASGLMIVLGSTLDGVPESIALGIALFANQTVGMIMIAAIVISNIPESIASIGGLKREKFPTIAILAIWISIGIVVALATILSFVFLHDLNAGTVGILESLAAGAILAMLAGGMMPEAYEEGGYGISILTIVGFLVTFVLSRI